MATLTETLAEIKTLQSAIATHGKLPLDMLRRIEYRFRLECNYYSNRMEGGTLTRQETRSVMTGNITVDNKPLKDILEMHGHDAMLLQILRVGTGDAHLSERRIKAIHQAIIVEEYPENQGLVGKWKQESNHIINARLERFDFFSPAEVPDAMHRLLDWLNAHLDKWRRNAKDATHPALLAFEFHHRFLTIHPFHDGNGRTARLLSNLILVASEYPPIYIIDEEKNTYNRYLTDIQGYGGSPDLFYIFMAGLLVRSLQLILNIVEGQEE